MMAHNKNQVYVKDLFNASAAQVPVARVICPESAEEISTLFRELLSSSSSPPIQVTVIGGGHSTLCTRPDAIVLDMRKSKRFSKVDVIKDENNGNDTVVVDVGGGATLSDIAKALKGSGWSVPVGTYGTVGIGLVLQGGIGFLTREFGLTIDCILQADVVDATGRVCRISKNDDNENDLLWALKGAGNQMGAVVTNIRLQTVPVEYIQLNRIMFCLASTEEMERELVRAWSLALTLPNTESLGCLIRRSPEENSFWLMLVHSSTQNDANGKGDNFFENQLPVNGKNILFQDSQWISYHKTEGLFGIPEPFVSRGVDFGGNPPIATIHCAFLGGDKLVKSLTEMASFLVQRLCDANSFHGKIVHQIDFQHTGGVAKTNMGPTETAFWNRNQEFSCVISCLYSDSLVGGAGEQHVYDWLDAVEHDLKQLQVKVGTYSVDIMRRGQGKSKLSTEVLLDEAYGGNWKRIFSIRKSLDPHGFMRPHGV